MKVGKNKGRGWGGSAPLQIVGVTSSSVLGIANNYKLLWTLVRDYSS